MDYAISWLSGGAIKRTHTYPISYFHFALLYDQYRPRGATTFSKLGVQFLGLGYYTEQNMDGIPNFVHCSVLHNGNHTLHQESWGGPSPQWLRPCTGLYNTRMAVLGIAGLSWTRALTMNVSQCYRRADASMDVAVYRNKSETCVESTVDRTWKRPSVSAANAFVPAHPDETKET